MTKDQVFTPLVKFTIVIAGFVLIIAGMMAASELLVALFLAFIFAVIITPLKNWLERRGLPSWLSFLLTILLMFLLVVGVVFFVVLSIEELVQVLPEYADSAEGIKSSLASFFGGLGIDISGVLNLDAFDPTNLLGLAGAFLGALVGSLANVFLVLLVLIFMLLEATGFSGRLRQNFDLDSPMLARVGEFTNQIREYITITTWVNLLIGIIDTVFLIILGIPFPVLWGVLAFFMGYIPSIGFWISMIPPFLLALLEYGLTRALIILVGYVLINGGIQNFVEPRLYGKGLNLSPLVVVLSLFFWAWVLGPIGALIAVPLTMMVMKLLLESFDETKPLVKLMQSSPYEEEGSSDAA